MFLVVFCFFADEKSMYPNIFQTEYVLDFSLRTPFKMAQDVANVARRVNEAVEEGKNHLGKYTDIIVMSKEGKPSWYIY